MNDKDKVFNEAANAYLSMFGGSLPFGDNCPPLTVELLLRAVKEKQSIQEYPLPDGAVS